MARIRGPISYKFRVVALTAVAAIFILYITLPDFGDGDSIFNKDSSAKKGPGGGKIAWPRNQVQFPFKHNGRVAGDHRKAEEVKAVMKRTFWKYRLGAWGADEIKPISGQGRTTRWARDILFLSMSSMCGVDKIRWVQEWMGGHNCRHIDNDSTYGSGRRIRIGLFLFRYYEDGGGADWG